MLRLHRRRRRRSLYRGHGRARRLTVRAAAAVMARLIRIVDAVAVLRAVDDAHVVVSHSTRVLAVFIITRAAAVLHRCSHRSAHSAWLLFAGVAPGRFCRGGGCEEWTSAAMEDECGSAGSATACVDEFCVSRAQAELAACKDTSNAPNGPVDAVA